MFRCENEFEGGERMNLRIKVFIFILKNLKVKVGGFEGEVFECL